MFSRSQLVALFQQSRLWLARVSALLLIDAVFLATTGHSADPTFVRLTYKDGGATRSTAGALVDGGDGDARLRIFDFRTYAEQSLDRKAIVTLKKPATEQDIVSLVGPGPFVAWSISRTLPPQPRSGRVVSVDKSVAYADIGKRDGVKTADRVDVFRGDEPVKDPTTGEVLGTKQRRIGAAEVLDVQDKLCKVRLTGDVEFDLQVADLVRPASMQRAVAVLPLGNQDGRVAEGGIVIADEVLAFLAKSNVPLVERTKQSTVLAELGIQQTGLFDERTIQKVGKQIGCFAVVTGSIQDDGRQRKVGIRLVEVETGKVLFAGSFTVRDSYSVRASETTAPAPVTVPSLVFTTRQVEELTYRGKWLVRSGVLLNDKSSSMVALPDRIDTDDYDIRFTLRRTEGDDAFAITLPIGSHNVMVNVSTNHGREHGLSYINRRSCGDGNETTVRPGKIENGKDYDLVARVKVLDKKASIKVSLSGKEVIDWSGSEAVLSSDDGWTPPDRDKIGLGVSDARYEIRDIRIRCASSR